MADRIFLKNPQQMEIRAQNEPITLLAEHNVIKSLPMTRKKCIRYKKNVMLHKSLFLKP
jgi:hypothetical protein